MPPRLSPLLPFATAFVCGILCATFGLGAWGIPVSALAGGIALWRGQRVLGSALLGLSLGLLAVIVRTPHNLPDEFHGKTATWAGDVLEIRRRDIGSQMIVAVDSCDGRPCPPFKARVMAFGERPGNIAGYHVVFRGSMRHIRVGRDYPFEPDGPKFLRLRGVSAIGNVHEGDMGAITPAHGFFASVRRMRADLGRLVSRMDLEVGTEEFLRATLLGEGHIVEYEQRELFKRAGLAHMLALSGVHVAVITLLLWILCFPLMAWGLWRTRMAIVIVGLWAFALLTGLTPSVTRAVAMTSVLLLSAMMSRLPDTLNALCLAAVLILAFDPVALFMPGFQMSFLAVLAIILYLLPLRGFSLGLGRFRGLFDFALLCLLAFAVTAPVSAWWFGELHPTSLRANLVATLLLPPLLICGAVGMLLTALGIGAGWIARLADTLYSLIERSAADFGRSPADLITIPHIPLWVLLSYLLLFILGGFALRQRSRALGFATLLGALALIIAIPLHPTRVPERDFHILRTSVSTAVAVKDGPTLTILTNARPDPTGELEATYRRRFASYISVGAIDTLRLLHPRTPYIIHHAPRRLIVLTTPTDPTTLQSIHPTAIPSSDPNTLQSSDHPTLPQSDQPTLPAEHFITNLLIGRGFRGDLPAIISHIHPDTVLLSPDLHPTTRTRLHKTLTALNQTTILLEY